MKKLTIPSNVTRAFHKGLFQVKKHSPEILAVVGVVGTVTSAVLACKATLKVHDVVDKAKNDIDDIHEATETGVTKAGDEYTAEDSKKDLTIVYAQTGVQLVKLYAPAVVLGVASIGCLLASNGILHKRNAALAAAYTAVDNGFKEYRNRVVERFGKELDQELKYNVKTKEIEETVVNEDGTETKVKKTVNVVDPNMKYSVYARCFDETCIGWERDAEYNLMFLRQQQSFLNDLLRTRGHVYLNELYDALGMQRSKAGQVVGWVYDEEHPIGDNFIDLGIYELHDADKRAFVNGHERSIWIDPNVDGNILELMQ